jgi:hypothetical protein
MCRVAHSTYRSGENSKTDPHGFAPGALARRPASILKVLPSEECGTVYKIDHSDVTEKPDSLPVAKLLNDKGIASAAIAPNSGHTDRLTITSAFTRFLDSFRFADNSGVMSYPVADRS